MGLNEAVCGGGRAPRDIGQPWNVLSVSGQRTPLAAPCTMSHVADSIKQTSSASIAGLTFPNVLSSDSSPHSTCRISLGPHTTTCRVPCACRLLIVGQPDSYHVVPLDPWYAGAITWRPMLEESVCKVIRITRALGSWHSEHPNNQTSKSLAITHQIPAFRS